MSATADLLHHSLTRVLGWTLLHLLWQGTLVGLLLAGVLTILRRSTADARYVACCAALLVLTACPCLTFALLAHSSAETGTMGTSAAVPVSVAASHTHRQKFVRLKRSERTKRSVGSKQSIRSKQSVRSKRSVRSKQSIRSKQSVRSKQLVRSAMAARLAAVSLPTGIASATNRLLPVLNFCWCVGVVLMSLRLLGGWVSVRRLTHRAAQPITGELQARCMALAHQMGIIHAVELLESALIEVPSTFGWLRVVVLLPASALSGLSPAALEALLAHELAHVRRCDYVVNLLQTALETLLFYHPATWWISRQIRQEREHCCDDLAVAILGDARGYARALAALETCRQSLSAPVLNATDGELLLRIRRVLGVPTVPAGPTPTGAAATIMITLFGISALALTLPTAYREGAAVARGADRSVRRTFTATLLDLFGPQRHPTAHGAPSHLDRLSRRQHKLHLDTMAEAETNRMEAIARDATTTKGAPTDQWASLSEMTDIRYRTVAEIAKWTGPHADPARPFTPDAPWVLSPVEPAVPPQEPAPPSVMPQLPSPKQLALTVNAALKVVVPYKKWAVRDDSGRGDAETAEIDHESPDHDSQDTPDAHAIIEANGNIDGKSDAVVRMAKANTGHAADLEVKRALEEADHAISEAMRTAGADVDRALANMSVQFQQAHRELERAREQFRQVQQNSRRSLELARHATQP